jgi:hypothetical protein
MRRRRTIIRLIGGLALLGAAACETPPPLPPPAVPLQQDEREAALACQKTITQQTSRVTKKAYEQLERCSQDMLAFQLELELRLNSSTIGEFSRRREEVIERCEAAFARIGRATTRMIDAIVTRCEALEDVLLTDPLRGDPLGWKTNWLLGSFAQAEIVEQLAGGLCSITMASVKLNASVAIARSADLIAKVHGPQAVEDFSDYMGSFFDPRCRGELELDDLGS